MESDRKQFESSGIDEIEKESPVFKEAQDPPLESPQFSTQNDHLGDSLGYSQNNDFEPNINPGPNQIPLPETTNENPAVIPNETQLTIKNTTEEKPKEAIVKEAEVKLAPQPVPQKPIIDETEYWPAKPKGFGSFTIQVASALSQTEAKNLVSRFKAKGFEAYYYLASNGRFPVRVNRYDTMAEAESDKSRLEEAGAKNPYISRLNN
jgi:cell division septation protein DedD